MGFFSLCYYVNLISNGLCIYCTQLHIPLIHFFKRIRTYLILGTSNLFCTFDPLLELFLPVRYTYFKTVHVSPIPAGNHLHTCTCTFSLGLFFQIASTLDSHNCFNFKYIASDITLFCLVCFDVDHWHLGRPCWTVHN